jgi:hypothetical protein
MRRILDAPAVPAPCATVAEGLRVRKLVSSEVFEEGARMRHCAERHADEVERGELMLFAVSYGRERLTVSARPQRSGAVVLEQIAGPVNIRPSPAAQAAVQTWLATGAGGIEEVNR